MKAAGFRGLQNEWWHFSALDRPAVRRRRLPMVESFED